MQKYKFDPFGRARIRELFEEKEKLKKKLEEQDRAIKAQERYLKGLVKDDIQPVLERNKKLKEQAEALKSNNKKLWDMYRASEEARQNLAEKLERANIAIEEIRGGPLRPSVSTGAPLPEGEARREETAV